MPGWMQDWPVLGVFLFFLFGAVARSQAIYWVGRGVTAPNRKNRKTPRTGQSCIHPGISGRHPVRRRRPRRCR